MKPRTSVSSAMSLMLLAGSAAAVPVNGVLDRSYGAVLSTQTTQTSLGDQPADFLNGSAR